jgi:hypothetical protein
VQFNDKYRTSRLPKAIRLHSSNTALEDAKLSKQDISTLLVDFTLAFNTTDHDKLLRIMYDLGPPKDVIDVV